MRLTLDRRQAAALLVVLGLLAVMSTMGISFARMMTLERQAARDHYHRTNARFLAHAGMQRVLGEIRRALEDGSLAAAPWLQTAADHPTENIETTQRVSFPHDANGNGTIENGLDGTPPSDRIYGRMVSGVIQAPKGFAGMNYNSDYDANGMSYLVRVVDCSGLLHLNGNRDNLARLLENLGQALAEEQLFNPLAGKGETIRSLRDSLPGAKFTDLAQLKQVLADDAWNLVRHFVTLDAWEDPDTVKPVPYADRAKGGLAAGSTVGAMEELAPRTVPLQPRTPVHVNTAPRAVLVAILIGVRGFRLEEDLAAGSGTDEQQFYSWVTAARNYDGAAGRLGRIVETRAVDLATAGKLADSIVARRKNAVFTHWAGFAKFLEEQEKAGAIDAGQRWALLANFNPNTNLNESNPSSLVWRPIDKTDLITGTTELIFGSTGRFRVESLGRVTKNGGLEMASIVVRSEVQAFSVLRETTQKQFLADYLKTGSFNDVLSSATSTVENRGLRAFPELPQFAAEGTYDGHLTLATVRRGKQAANLLYAALDAALSGEGAAGSVSPVTDAASGPQVARLLPSGAAARWGNLRPDGAYTERGAALAYPSQGSWNPLSGALSMWIKPNWDPAKTPRPHGLLSVSRLWRDAASASTGAGDLNPYPWGVWYFPPALGGAQDYGPYAWFPALARARAIGFAWALKDAKDQWATTGIASNTVNHDGHGHAASNALAGRRWAHLAVAWNWAAATPAERVQMWINGQAVPGGNAFHNGIPGNLMQGLNWHLHADGSANHLRVGEQAKMPAFNYPADATVGELRSYANHDSSPQSDYQAGRYPNQPGIFYSAARHFDKPVLVSHVSFTAYTPPELPGSRVTVKVYDTNGTASRSDDVLLVEGFPADGQLKVGKRAKGIRYEVVLAANPGTTTGQKCTYELTLKVTSGPGSKSLSHLTTGLPSSVIGQAVATQWNSQGWSQIGQGLDPTTNVTGFKYDNLSGFGGEGNIHTVTYRFKVPCGSLSQITVCTKAGNTYACSTLALVPGTKTTDSLGYTVEVVNVREIYETDPNATPVTAPVTESPVFDDITILYSTGVQETKFREE